MKTKILGTIALVLFLSMLIVGCAADTATPEAVVAPTTAPEQPAAGSIEGMKVCYLDSRIWECLSVWSD